MKRISLVMMLAIGLGGCVLYEEIPSVEELSSTDCGECGPCGVGVVDCESQQCVLEEPWSLISEEVRCDALVMVAEDGKDYAPGTIEEPVATLGRALELVNSIEGAAVVVMGGGEWTESVTIEEGIALIGGVDRTLQSHDDRPLIKVDGDEEHVAGIEIIGVRRSVAIIGIEVDVSGGMTNYGVRIVDSGRVELRSVRIRARSGGDGEPGEDGDDGERGTPGENGGRVNEWDFGFGGVNEACPVANGGDGGQGARDGLQDASQGQDSAGGALGRWGVGENGFEVQDGEDGVPGGFSLLEDGFWVRGEDGSKGEDGEHGVGGGGGAGGGVNGSGAGGGGGGGGAGGCGGNGGAGGTGGGSSIGVLVVESQVALRSADIFSGDGGNGARGGSGGLGAEGRREGAGASGKDLGASGFDGGTGGDGGDGGRGGFGRGGNSYAILCGGDSDETGVTLEEVNLEHGRGGRGDEGMIVRVEGREIFGCDLN